jgi:hypothetical protein
MSTPEPGHNIPEWIVNNLGELGVRVNGRCFFLYKGRTIEYSAGHAYSHEGAEGSEMEFRTVGKREFGEVCHPAYPGLWDEWCQKPLYTAGDGWRLIPVGPNGDCPDCHGLGEVHVRSPNDPGDVTVYDCERCFPKNGPITHGCDSVGYPKDDGQKQEGEAG